MLRMWINLLVLEHFLTPKLFTPTNFTLRSHRLKFFKASFVWKMIVDLSINPLYTGLAIAGLSYSRESFGARGMVAKLTVDGLEC